MGKISDIWVRLGLKKNEFDKGMDDAAKKAEGFGGAFNKVKTVALAAWAAIGTAVVAFVKDFVNHSQTMGDAWSQATGQMKAVWSQFLTSLTNWDWEGFGQRIRNSMSAASESITAHDAEFEVMNSIKMRKAAMAEELAQLEIIMRDTRKSYDERAKAAQDYLDKVAPLYQQEIDLRKRIYQTDTAEYLQNAGVQATADNADLLRKFFTDIAPNENLMRQLVEYQKKNLGQSYELSKSDLASIDKFYEQYGMRAAATLTTIASYYQATNDDVANKVIDAIVGYDKSLAAMNEATRRIQNLKNSAISMSDSGAGPAGTDAEANLAKVKSAHEIAFKLGKEMQNDIRLLNQEFSEIGDIEIDLSDVDAEINAFLAEWQYGVEQIASLNNMLEDAIVSSVANGLQALADMAVGLEGADMKNALAAFIAPFGDTMKQMGAMIMAEGLAMTAFKNSWGNPATAIAAGAALMAIGSVVSAGLQKMTQNPVGGGSSASYGSSSYGSNPALNYESTLNIEVTGKISGSDILIAGNKTNNNWNR